ncbi:MAG: 30S ribosomal protein S3, partial [Armatimonadetes bacterium]|nr:30S ribosomal protein S3 [Armatimonadota bacterium]
RGGRDVDDLRHKLEKLTGKRTRVNVEEVQDPDINAQLIAENIARQIERRVSHRWAMRQALDRAIKQGAKGIKIKVSGRLGGVEIARSETMGPIGRVPLSTLRADVDYGLDVAHTTYGPIGVKVWVYKGEILPERKPLPEEETASEFERELEEAQRQLHGEEVGLTGARVGAGAAPGRTPEPAPVEAAKRTAEAAAAEGAEPPPGEEAGEAGATEAAVREGDEEAVKRVAPPPKPVTFESVGPDETPMVAELLEEAEPVIAEVQEAAENVEEAGSAGEEEDEDADAQKD